MAHDVFISYSSTDKAVADRVCIGLEQSRVRCWIAPRDVSGGSNYAESIIEAISASPVMVLIFSAGSNESAQVLREVERAVSKGMAIIPFRIENVPLSKLMEYFVSSNQWLDAFQPPFDARLAELTSAVQRILSRGSQSGARAGWRQWRPPPFRASRPQRGRNFAPPFARQWPF